MADSKTESVRPAIGATAAERWGRSPCPRCGEACGASWNFPTRRRPLHCQRRDPPFVATHDPKPEQW
jgi:hypothetical protein